MPLSNPQVINLLAHDFVPVIVNYQRYQAQEDASPSEKAALYALRVKMSKARGLRFSPEELATHVGLNPASQGIDPTYAMIFDDRGEPVELVPIHEIRRLETTLAALQRVVRRLHPVAGGPLGETSLTHVPTPPAGGLTVHVVARYLGNTGLSMDDVLHAFPSEAWLTFTKDELASLIPPSATDGASWKVASPLFNRLIHEFYPQTELSAPFLTRVQSGALTARCESTAGVGTNATHTLVRLQGEFRLRHPWWNMEDEKYAEGSLVGFAWVNRATGQVESLRLVTFDASYAGAHGWSVPIGVMAASPEVH